MPLSISRAVTAAWFLLGGSCPRCHLTFTSSTTSSCASIRKRTIHHHEPHRRHIAITFNPFSRQSLYSSFIGPSDPDCLGLYLLPDIGPRGLLPSTWAPSSLFPPFFSLQLLQSGQSEHHVAERLLVPCCVVHAACPSFVPPSLPESRTLSFFWSIASSHGSCSLLGPFGS